MTKILFVTDLHERFDLEPIFKKETDVDLLLIGGDIAYSDAEFAKFISNVAHVMDRYKVKQTYYVLGNHDVYTPNTMLRRGEIESIVYRKVEFDGLTIGGMSYNWEPDTHQSSILHQLQYCDILVSHAPPYNTRCDIAEFSFMVNPVFTDDEMNHAGSVAIKAYIYNYHPRLVLCGHIHESAAIEEIEGTQICNPGDFWHHDGYVCFNMETDKNRKLRKPLILKASRI